MDTNSYISFLKDNDFDKNHLYNRSLFDHLYATYQLAMKLECPVDVCIACLFHSVYDKNNAYNFSGIEIADRQILQKLIGKNAEELVYFFWGSEYNQSLKENLNRQDNFFIIINDDKVFINKQTTVSLLNMSAVNLLEQVEYFLNKSLATGKDLLNYLIPYKDGEHLLSESVYNQVKTYIDICDKDIKAQR